MIYLLSAAVALSATSPGSPHYVSGAVIVAVVFVLGVSVGAAGQRLDDDHDRRKRGLE